MTLFGSWLASPPPDAAVEITPARVAAASLVERGGKMVLEAYAVQPLAPNTVTPGLASHNISNRPAVVEALRATLDRLGTRPSRVALIIPDISAKVSILRFEQMPDRRDDLDQLVRWQVRKSAPFAIDEACVTYTPGMRINGGGELVVVLARRDIVREYEEVCEAAGVHAGLIDLSTFSVLNLLLAAQNRPSDDWLAVHMRPEYTSIAIARGRDLIFFRNRPEGDEESLADVVHQTAMYYQDRLSGQGIARVLLGGGGRAAGTIDQARRELEERLGATVEPIDPTTVVSLPDRIGVTTDLMDVLAPLSGMLLRTRTHAAN
jgi:Tfp pilus assembly PilM family ATPase